MLAPARAELLQRRHVLIVGSSTAYPIIAAAAEHFGRESGLVTPVVESGEKPPDTGTFLPFVGPRASAKVPVLGEHTEAVLAELT